MAPFLYVRVLTLFSYWTFSKGAKSATLSVGTLWPPSFDGLVQPQRRARDASTDSTVAVEIRGESLGSFFDRWIVFYHDVRRLVRADQKRGGPSVSGRRGANSLAGPCSP
jgi:hypothetical protein